MDSEIFPLESRYFFPPEIVCVDPISREDPGLESFPFG